MRPLLPIRAGLALTGLTLWVMFAALVPLRAQPHRAVFGEPAASFALHAQQHVNPQPAPIERRPRPAAGAKPAPAVPNGPHLAEWMSRHSNLTPDQQQKALEQEPGFRDLPPSTQQRMRERIAELNAMPPAQRQRLLDRNEAMERLTVPQRRQVDAAMKQLADLPPDQRRYVARTFRGLRELSPPQRQAVLNSERFNHLTDAQRASLNSLLQVEPLLLPPYDGGAPPPQ